jgi:V8-like Glu-specific endopeptidase
LRDCYDGHISGFEKLIGTCRRDDRHRTCLTRRATRRTRPALDPLEGRALLSLSGVAPTAGFPYTAIVELQATFPDHKTYLGSAVMVDSFHALTAGHMIYSSADGGFASSVLAIPGLYGSSLPFGVAWATYERTFAAFVTYNQTHPGVTAPGDYDIGMVTLNRAVGNSTGWMSYGYDNNNADFAPGTVYNTAGYPAAGGYDGRHLEFSAGALAGLSPDGSALDFYQSSITVYAGQSGSPVWRYTPSTNTRVVYAVVAGGNGTAGGLNIATRITQPIFSALQQWRSSDVVPRTSAISALGMTSPPAKVGAVAAAPSVPAAPTQPPAVRALATSSPAVTPWREALARVAVPRGPMWVLGQAAAPRRAFA